MTELLAKKRANDIRNQLGLGQSPIADIFNLLEDLGIILFKRPLHENSLSAFFMRDKRNYLVVVNSAKTLGHQIFSAAHELSHYYFDREVLGGICSASSFNSQNSLEKSADLFAVHFLMPDEGVISAAEKRTEPTGKLELYDLVFLQQYFRVSWTALLWKLNNLGYIHNPEELKNAGITRLTKLLGYKTDLISASCDTYVSKRYLEMALKCYEKDEISRAKLDEYLEDAGISLPELDVPDNAPTGGDVFAD